MENYTCILVDDEPIALDILQTYIKRMDFLKVRGSFYSPLEAFGFLQQQQVDLAFIDINMPELTGLQLIQSLAQKPKIIMTTAYREYAHEGFELDVVDYLVKPISYERFLKAVSKVFKQEMPMPLPADLSHHFLFIKQDKKHIKVYIKDIIYLESQRDFVEVHTGQQKYFTRETLTYFEDLLPEESFLRIHRRYIISLQSIHYIKEDEVYLLSGALALPVGKTYKETLALKLNLK